MSGAQEALLIVAHGEAGGAGANRLAAALTRRMAGSGHFSDVALAFIRGGPSVAEAAARLSAPRLRVYPLFISDGYFVREAIPHQLGLKDGIDAFGHAVSIEEPFGGNAALPPLLVAAVGAAARARGVDPASATLMLVAHGSRKSAYSRNAALRIRDRMAGCGAFAGIEVSFIEEEPIFDAMLPGAARPLLVLALLAGEGMHASDDIEGAIDALGDPGIHLVARLGGYQPIVEMIAEGLGAARHAGA